MRTLSPNSNIKILRMFSGGVEIIFLFYCHQLQQYLDDAKELLCVGDIGSAALSVRCFQFQLLTICKQFSNVRKILYVIDVF